MQRHADRDVTTVAADVPVQRRLLAAHRGQRPGPETLDERLPLGMENAHQGPGRLDGTDHDRQRFDAGPALGRVQALDGDRRERVAGDRVGRLGRERRPAGAGRRPRWPDRCRGCARRAARSRSEASVARTRWPTTNRSRPARSTWSLTSSHDAGLGEDLAAPTAPAGRRARRRPTHPAAAAAAAALLDEPHVGEAVRPRVQGHRRVEARHLGVARDAVVRDVGRVGHHHVDAASQLRQAVRRRRPGAR